MNRSILSIPLMLTAFAFASLGFGHASHHPESGTDVVAEEEIAALRSEVSQLRITLSEVEEKLKFVVVQEEEIKGVKGPHVIFTGCNLHVRSGGGASDEDVKPLADEQGNRGRYSGLGNLIIGYNEGVVDAGDRHGAHNLVIGAFHNFPSCQGIVAGHSNSITGRNATICGGQGNKASGNKSCVVGGSDNSAAGEWASVLGGGDNRAVGEFSSVSGGRANRANGKTSSILGGEVNEANGLISTVSGGLLNQANGEDSSVSGGRGIKVEKKWSWGPSN